MAAQDNLPEGTDHIINGAMETHGDTIDSGSSSGAAKSDSSSGEGFVGSSSGNGTGGATGGAQPAGDGGLIETLRSQTESLRGQAGDRVRDFADSGKTRASDTLDGLSKVVADAADSIEERLGGDYAEYARKAGDAISGFSDTLRRKEVDELYDDVRSAVSKSPAIAIGIAAALGFTLVRLVKAGMPEESSTGGRSGGRGSDA
ncbi:MAG: hypothetical protein JWP15_1379 [Alphaproteobacteria bacterium]|nr:hypothetical protein [Alphaproteobacteria bacterium]